ncbi:MAG: hypothetical protein WAT19_09840 [Ferruginibacter sp.]
MQDTPQHIKDIQQKIWLTKTPGERLWQFLQDNDAMYKALLKAKEALAKEQSSCKTQKED